MAATPTRITIYIVLISSLVACSLTTDSLKMGFRRFDLCFLEERIRFGYSRALMNNNEGSIHSINNALECSRVCKVDDTCVGFSVTVGKVVGINQNSSAEEDGGSNSKAGQCYLHQEYLESDKCVNPEANHVYYRKYGVCYNGGVWNDEEFQCSCAGSSRMVGPLCTAVPRNCRDLSNSGFRPLDADVSIKPIHGQDKILRHCKIGENGETTIQVGSNGRTTAMFNRTWLEFENGFHGDDGDIVDWIGLEYLRGILRSTAEPSVLYMEVITKLNNPIYGYAKYYDVQIGDSSDGYRLTFSKYSLHRGFLDQSGHCLEHSNGMKFSTYDVDNDKNTNDNCAALNGVGWWFGAQCETPCNLFGTKYTFSDTKWKVVESYSIGQIRVPGMSINNLARQQRRVFMEILA